jgi:WD40 repeat protein
LTWTPDGKFIYASGDQMLAIIKRNTWELTYSKEVGHKKEITCLSFLTEDKFVTAGFDKVIKIWDHSTMQLLNYIVCEREILTV